MKIFVVVLSFVGLSISSPQFGFLNNLFGGGGRRPSGGRPSGGRPSGGGRCGGGNAPNHNFQVYSTFFDTFFMTCIAPKRAQEVTLSVCQFMMFSI